MNKYQEAKEWLNHLQDTWSLVNIDWPVIDTFKELVDRATPMENKNECMTGAGATAIYEKVCPKCETMIEFENGFPNYCRECGQALEWKE